MSLENVLQSIRQRGQRKAEEIRQEAKEEADRILEDAESEAEQKIEQAEAEAEADAEPLRRKELLGAEIEAKKLRLDAQRSAMESVRERAKERLGDLPDKERAQLLEALVDRVRDELESPQIYVAEADVDVVEPFAGDLLAGTEEIHGGVVAEDKTGEVRVDYSYETLLDEVWDDAIDDVSELLEVG